MNFHNLNYNKKINGNALSDELQVAFPNHTFLITYIKSTEMIYFRVPQSNDINYVQPILDQLILDHDSSYGDMVDQEVYAYDARKAHGIWVVDQFRIFAITMTVGGSQSRDLMVKLGDARSALEIGLLEDSIYLLGIIIDDLLDMQMSATQTVRQYFISLIQQGI